MSDTPNNLAAYIWSLADLLRGDFKQSQYGRGGDPASAVSHHSQPDTPVRGDTAEGGTNMTRQSARQHFKQGKNHAVGLFKRVERRQKSNSQSVFHCHSSIFTSEQANWAWILGGGRYNDNREARRCCWAKVIWVMSDNLDADPQEGPS
jgi:hypothetical protein